MMTHSISYPILCVSVLLSGCYRQPAGNAQAINPRLGDISFVERFGVMPAAATDEDLRISTHLAYVEDLLRKKNVSELPAELREKRISLLDFLHEYRAEAVFPRNYDFADKRVPCFIDRDGKICAVGYLIEKTAGREVAEQISASHQYEALLAMNDRLVDDWINASGLTREECAMIQPAYGPSEENSSYISTADAAFSGVLIGLNAGFAALNISNSYKGVTKQGLPAVSIISGGLQVGLGALELLEYDTPRFGGTDFTAMKKLGITNIAMGTASALIGVFTAVSNNKKKNRSTAWNIYSFPSVDGRMGVGLCWAKTL
jgi:hypothetical protein